MKQTILVLVISLIAILSGCQENPKKAKKRAPNILFAIADDASWKHFGAYGCDWVNTPAFDRVASNGILFTRAYTPNAKCAPSRSCILTGRNSWQLEEACNHSPNFPAKFRTYPEALSANGYFVGSVGKGWAPGNPGEIDGKRRALTGTNFSELKTTSLTTGISTNDYAANFEAFLAARPADKPFCFWFGCYEPHRGYEFKSGINKGSKKMDEIDEVPPFWPDVDTVRADMLDYAFEIEYFDVHLNRMLQKLDEIGELNNTIVIVTADNGMPFPRIKGQEYEYSNHLPLAISWPNGIKNPGRVVDDFVNFIDFAPTYLELAGLTTEKVGMQPIAGKSLTDIFYTEKEGIINPERDFVLIGKERHDVGRPNDEGYPIRGIIRDNYLYLRNFKPNRWPAGNPETGYLNCDGSPTKTYILDTRRKKGEAEYWQLNFGKRVSEELYDIKEDPFCMNNLAAIEDYTELRNTMSKEMTAKLQKQGDPRIFGNGDVFDNYEYSGVVKDYYNRYMQGEEVPANWVNKSDYDADFTIRE
ncbi:sulfatase family protein [Draconibacterium sediminis]|uniref:Heparan N-sulfatase n=1 Tax=Draconibacterium sediminis TaxID=1544798 RepID=A0A0D8JFN6_9BACT|nr:sulfatase [Draconibacterium sediminis]KJF45715.1 heparan N-sulfatase [Draconibacterium sediminis]